jgi:DNA-binding Xre family transcriptional regulator
MKANYIKLFKLLLDRKMKKGELCNAAGISRTALQKLSHGDNVNTEILVKICNALRCDFADIMEMEYDSLEELENGG